MTKSLITAFGAGLLCFAITTAAHATGREHGAHVHGISHLDIAVEGQTVAMALVSPGADIVGFEHAAETAEDKAAVAAAVKWLGDGGGTGGDRVFAFPPDAGCSLDAAEVASALHEEEDAHHEGEDAHHEGEDRAQDPGDHAAFHARYRFHCRHPDRLTHVDVGLFARFPGARKLVVRVVTPQGQSARELTPASPRLTF